MSEKIEPALNPEEMGKRLRALHIVMRGTKTHEGTLADYEERLREDVGGLMDPSVEGSWGWWGAKVMEPPRG